MDPTLAFYPSEAQRTTRDKKPKRTFLLHSSAQTSARPVSVDGWGLSLCYNRLHISGSVWGGEFQIYSDSRRLCPCGGSLTKFLAAAPRRSVILGAGASSTTHYELGSAEVTEVKTPLVISSRTGVAASQNDTKVETLSATTGRRSKRLPRS